MNPRLPPVLLIATSMILAGCLGFGSDEEDLPSEWVWVDPIDELENEDHSHGDLLAHRYRMLHMVHSGETCLQKKK